MAKKRERRKATNRYARFNEAEAILDFHDSGSVTSQEVRQQTLKFLRECGRNELVRVRIVTGKGLHSKGRPVVKPQVERVLREALDEGTISEYHAESLTGGGAGAFVVKF